MIASNEDDYYYEENEANYEENKSHEMKLHVKTNVPINVEGLEVGTESRTGKTSIMKGHLVNGNTIKCPNTTSFVTNEILK